MKTYVKTGGTSYLYSYTPTGHRIKKVNITANTTEWYMSDGSDVITDYSQSGSGAITLQTSYAQGTSIDSKVARITASGGAKHYYVPDAIGSVTHLIDSSQAIVNSEVTDAWGNVVASTTSVSDRYGFSQREKDSESGLMHYRARSYDPRIGRFLSKDPIRDRRPTAHYVYASNRPTSNVDPMGEQDSEYDRVLQSSRHALKLLLERYREESDPTKMARFGELYEEHYLSHIAALREATKHLSGSSIQRHLKALRGTTPYAEFQVGADIETDINISMLQSAGAINSVAYIGVVAGTVAELATLALEEIAIGKGTGLILRVGGKVIPLIKSGLKGRRLVEADAALGRAGVTHAFQRHAGSVTDDALRARIVNRSKDAATRFTDDKTLVETYMKILKGNRTEIETWAKTARPGDTASFALKDADQLKNLGSGFYRDAAGAPAAFGSELKGATAWLQMSEDGSVLLRTAFPHP